VISAASRISRILRRAERCAASRSEEQIAGDLLRDRRGARAAASGADILPDGSQNGEQIQRMTVELRSSVAMTAASINGEIS
jgi:hypothetical protein